LSEVLPSNANDVKKIIDERVGALSDEPGLKETVTVEWRDKPTPMPVITIPLELLSYNPATHRIRAQRSLDAVRDSDLQSDPFGSAAQSYLHQLLVGDPADPQKVDPSFEALKQDIQLHDQRDPGLITRYGVLINGNTRAAALKELGRQNIRVGVLPQDAGIEDIQAVELSLQLRRDHRRDYSFMNFLLAIDERVQAGWPSERIQKEFRIRKNTFERSQWILATVKELIDRSAEELGNGLAATLRLVDFESHQGKLEELHRSYISLKARAPEDAEALRERHLPKLSSRRPQRSRRSVRQSRPGLIKPVGAVGLSRERSPPLIGSRMQMTTSNCASAL
jgi:hypothetical protein